MLVKSNGKPAGKEVVNTMQERHLHIVCFDVPYPADYGGVYDLYYKIRALHTAGIKLHLHCFAYGRAQQPALEQFCEEIHYYARESYFKSVSTTLPYIVASRGNQQLLANLQKDNYPILMEGIHCTYFLHTGDLPGSRCFVRLPNVEHLYYHRLAETTTHLPKKWYYRRESKLLKAYEASLANKATFWTISQKDLNVFQHELGYHSVDNLPLYLPDYTPEWNGEKGCFCLYHGNLEVDENEHAAIWLLENVFNDIEIPFVIAGKNPSQKLQKLAHAQMHTCIVANPGEREMNELIKKAQVNVLPSFNETGVKLKLINALYLGRHCLVNTSGAEGSGLEHCCTIADSLAAMRKALVELYEKPYTYYTHELRMEKMRAQYCNERNARQMIGWIFEGEPTYPGYTQHAGK